jgi:hypothetical protein
MSKTFYIDGIASSEALDTSGEIVALKGLDISSLIDAAISWEHKKDSPAQLVGKILEAKKIFTKEDCENSRHLYYWNKCQLPFLYIKARLFNDKPSSQEVVALFKDDAEHPSEDDMLGFSVEGNKISKNGAIIDRSIARLVTLANHPANKSCIAEMAPSKDSKVDPDDIRELFKGEMQLFSFDPTYVQILEKKEELKKDVGGGGGAFIGSQLAMHEDQELKKAGWSKNPVIDSESVKYSHPQHGSVHISKTPVGNFEVRHNTKLVGVSPSITNAGKHAGKYMSSFGKIEKSLSAGSGMAAPGQLVGGAALAVEDLAGKKKLRKKEKSHWYDRAEQAYNGWDKKEQFKQYMKKRMPHLAEGEVDAVGRVLALKKDVQKEESLSKMYASYFNKSKKVEKGSDVMMAAEKDKKE